MKSIFKQGDKKEISVTVKPGDVATFETGNVHPVYSTFALARDAEWCTRQFVLEIRDDDEEGIGTMVYVDHLAPAPVGAKIKIEAAIEKIERHEILCSFKAKWNEKIIAQGRTGQKILKRIKYEKLFSF
jgi:fluoroacetyl-CoA thioesterase